MEVSNPAVRFRHTTHPRETKSDSWWFLPPTGHTGGEHPMDVQAARGWYASDPQFGILFRGCTARLSNWHDPLVVFFFSEQRLFNFTTIGKLKEKRAPVTEYGATSLRHRRDQIVKTMWEMNNNRKGGEHPPLLRMLKKVLLPWRGTREKRKRKRKKRKKKKKKKEKEKGKKEKEN